MCDVLAPPDPSLGHLAPYKPLAPRKTLICMKNRCNQYFLYLVSTFLKSCLVMLWHHQSLHWATGPPTSPRGLPNRRYAWKIDATKICNILFLPSKKVVWWCMGICIQDFEFLGGLWGPTKWKDGSYAFSLYK